MHDVVIVGAGISGLLSALALAKEGKKVLVLEKNDYVGGVCRSYKVDGYQVDTGPHMITRTESGPLRQLMDNYFDVVPNFVPHGGYYVRLNGRVKPFPWNLRGWFNFDLIPQMDRLYLLKTLFSVSYIFNSGSDMSKMSLGDLVGENLSPSTMRFLNCLSYFMTGSSMKETPVARFLDAEHYKSQSKNLLDKLYNILMKEGAKDQMYPKGGLNSLINAVLSSLPEKRVEIRRGEEVLRIEGDEVKNVETSVDEYSCNTVVYSGFASDLPQVFDGLPEQYMGSLKKLYKVDALTVWLGLDKRFFARKGSEIWADSDPYTWVVPTSNYDPSLAPKGKQLASFASMLPKDCDIEKGKRKALETIFHIMPEIEDHTEMSHFQVLIPEKAVLTVDTVFANVRTPVAGLYLVGTDTERRSMGVTRASYSVLNLLSALGEDGIL
ncbi:MAG: NAD(P)/FAD-dependent oxidoreductase [Candidatus Altiarchaeota archaeon]|nr:NAD(P)/FAD-dependent oxidoreductase [Candidatus Altiarchaeota archaeon]